MVEYKCNRCGRSFDRRTTLDKHLNRVYPCDRMEAKRKCEYCNSKFSRKDTLDRHIKTFHSDMIGKSIDDRYFILPFGNYQLDEDLTITEKIDIFTSRCSIIEMVVFKTHLNLSLEKYHNCGISDLHSGYGIIYDGNNWKCWPIKDIMDVIIENCRQNSLDLYNKIKHFIRNDTCEEIENELNTVKNFFGIDAKVKKRLVLSLKSNFYDQRNLVQIAIKNSGKQITKYEKTEKNTKQNFLKEGVTIEDIDNHLSRIKEAENKNNLSLKKEVAMYILEGLDKTKNMKYNELTDQINNTDNVNHMNIIIRILNKSYCYNVNINNIKINNEIKRQLKMNEIVFS